jgi:hypothetical protein
MPSVSQASAYPQEPGCISVPDEIAAAMTLMRGPLIAAMFAAISRAREANIPTSVIVALFQALPKRNAFVAALDAQVMVSQIGRPDGFQIPPRKTRKRYTRRAPSVPAVDTQECAATAGSLQLFSANEGEVA